MAQRSLIDHSRLTSVTNGQLPALYKELIKTFKQSDLTAADYIKVRKMLLTYGPALGVSEEYMAATGHLTGVYTGLVSHKIDLKLASSSTKIGGKVVKGLGFRREIDRDLSKIIVQHKYETNQWRTSPKQYEHILVRQAGSKLWSHNNKPNLLIIGRGKRLLTEFFNLANKNKEGLIPTFLAELIHDSNYSTDLL